MGPNNPWADPMAPPQGFSLPVSMGPMALPPQKPKRRWGEVVAWMLFAFAGGVAAGPTLNDYAFTAVESSTAFFGKHVPWLLGRFRPAPPVAAPVPAPHAAPSRPLPAAPPKAPVRAAAPVAAVGLSAPQVEKLAEPEVPAARPAHAKGAVKTPPVAVAAPVKKRAKNRDPFEAGGEGASEPAAAPKREPKPAPVEAAVAKSEPAAARSSDGLDNLMADVVTENKGKGKKRESKAIDAMLKDVQKSEPAPSSKRAEPTALPPLSAADIAKVMAKVKTRGKSCAQQFGGKGIAELNLTVGKDGKVSDAVVGGNVADTPLAACIQKAARAATFPPNAGLRFDYKIDVR